VYFYECLRQPTHINTLYYDQIDYTGYLTVKITGITVGKHAGDLAVENSGGVLLEEITVMAYKELIRGKNI